MADFRADCIDGSVDMYGKRRNTEEIVAYSFLDSKKLERSAREKARERERRGREGEKERLADYISATMIIDALTLYMGWEYMVERPRKSFVPLTPRMCIYIRVASQFRRHLYLRKVWNKSRTYREIWRKTTKKYSARRKETRTWAFADALFIDWVFYSLSVSSIHPKILDISRNWRLGVTNVWHKRNHLPERSLTFRPIQTSISRSISNRIANIFHMRIPTILLRN